MGLEVLTVHTTVTSLLANGKAASIWKLHSHWLKRFPQYDINIIIQTPGLLCGLLWWFKKYLLLSDASFKLSFIATLQKYVSSQWMLSQAVFLPMPVQLSFWSSAAIGQEACDGVMHPDTVRNESYHQISNISCTKSPNSNVSHFILQLPLPNPLKPGVK